MKSKHLLLLLLMALAAPWAAMAQQTLTVYENETSTNSYIPLYGFNGDHYQKTEFIIPANQLEIMNGGTISGMKFYISGTSPTKIWGPLQVFLKEVENTTISAWSGTDGATTVYTGNFDGTSGTIDVVFNGETPTYSYNGGNLLVGIYLTTTNGQWNSASFLGKNVNGASGNGDNDSALESCSFTQRNFIPKTTFTYLTTDPYISLSPSSATLMLGNTQTLTATYGNVNGTPTITYTTSDANVATVSGSGTSATVTPVGDGVATITATMNYEGTDYTATSTITVMEACQPTWTSSTYYIGNFKVTSSGETLLDNSSTGTGGTTTNYYATKSITAMPGDELSCVITMSGSGTYGFALWIDFDQDGLEASDKMFGTTSYISSPYNGTFTIPANTPVGEYRLRILGDYNTNAPSNPCGSYSNGEAEDYKLIVYIPEYPKPVNPHLVVATGTTANIAWTAPESTHTISGYSYNYKKHDEQNWSSEGSTTVSVLEATINNLDPLTDYDFRVKALYDNNTVESEYATTTFTTTCPDNYPLDYTCGFEGPNTTGSYPMPLCWTRMGSNTSYPNVSSSNYHEGTRALYFYKASSSTYNNEIAALPAIDAPLNTVRVVFYGKLSSTSTDGTINVGYVTDLADATTFHSVETVTLTTTYAKYTVSLGNVGEVTGNIAFQALYSTATASIYIDDVLVEEIPSCVEPSGLEVVANSITANSVQLTWTAGGTETTWDIYCTTSAEAPTTATTPTVTGTTDNPCTVNGLTASSHYYAYVRARCSDSDQSPWSTAVEFDTDCETVTTFPFSQDFNSLNTNGQIPVCWDNSAGSTTIANYKWCYYSGTSQGGTTGTGHNSTNCIRFESFNNSSSYTNFLKTPVMNFPAGKIMQLTFWYKNPAGGDFSVYISTDGGATYTTALATNLRYQSSWAEKEIVLNDYVGTENVVIVFKGTSNYGNGDAYIYLDDVVIAEAPVCIKPSNLVCDSKTAHTATLSWTNGEEGQNAWVIAYSTDPDFNPDDPNVSLQGTLTNPATLEYLNQSTTYYAYVRADCGVEDGVSAWCNAKVTFTTLAGNVTPTGLAVAPASITSSQATASWNAVAGNTLHESYDIYWDLATVTAVPAEPAASNLISGITATSQDITGLEPETSYKVWVRDNCGTDGYSNWSSAVTFTTAASCQTPDGLAESEVTTNSAKITWNTYGLTDFNLAYSTDGTTWTTVEHVNTPYTFPNNLTANTAYQVKVQATCADAETWSTVLNFRTECDAITITDSYSWTENFEAPVTTATYNSTGVLLIMPYCWDNYLANNSSSYAIPHLISSTAGDSYNFSNPKSQVLFFYGQDGYAALPEFTNSLSELQISFKWAVESKSYGTLKLGYITDEDNGTYNTFQSIEDFASSSATAAKTMEDATVYLDNVPATASRLVFLWTGTSSWYCNIDDVKVALLPSCYPVENLTYSDVLATTVKLSWDLVDDTQDAWQVCLNGDEDHLIAATTHENFLLENLSPETAYTVKVRANCGDSQGEWSNEISFTTLEACPAPSGLAASNLTQNTADLTWTGESDSYNVQYRTAAGATTNQLLFEGFETYTDETALEAVWTVLDLGDGANTAELGLYDGAKKTGDYGFRFSSYNGSSSGDFDQYLISPELTQAGLLEFAYKSSSGTTDKFRVGYSSTTNEVSAFTWGDEMASASSWKTFSETMPENAKYFAINYTAVYKYRLYIDDITIYELNPAGAWQDATSTTTSTQLTGLTAGTEYEVQVQGVCNNVPGNWSETFTFTTMAEGNKVFTDATADGKWSTANNWMPVGVPTLTDEVIIRANATIESTSVAEANCITFEGTPTPTLTIEDGGQLVHNAEGVHAIVKKNIAGYTTSSTNGGWYFISSPIMSSSSYDYGITPNAAGLITDNFGNSIPDGETATYDLYRFVESPGNDLEWKNYRKSSFNLDRTEGYLYANVNDVTLSFEGVIRRSDQIAEGGLDNTSGASFAGWNLMGNPFTCKAYSSLPYYVIDGSGSRLNMTAVLATTPIDVCTGVMVNANDGSLTSVKFSRTPQESANNGNVQMTLSQQVVNRDGSSAGLMTIDNAIVSFNESDQLEKFVFNSSLAKLYIPQYDKDYAIVASEGQGTLPVNFKATENGTYSLNVNVEGVEMSYLHLIDNMTGADVDLLANPSYSFDALTTDYESRFKLVFATGNAADDNFAFYSNGNWIINNDGEATLQVIDVTGRILSSETVAGSVSKAIHAAPGVYMLRLVNGNNVKVQKVVVR